MSWLDGIFRMMTDPHSHTPCHSQEKPWFPEKCVGDLNSGGSKIQVLPKLRMASILRKWLFTMGRFSLQCNYARSSKICRLKSLPVFEAPQPSFLHILINDAVVIELCATSYISIVMIHIPETQNFQRIIPSPNVHGYPRLGYGGYCSHPHPIRTSEGMRIGS